MSKSRFYNVVRNADKGVIEIYGYIGDWWNETDFASFKKDFQDLEKDYEDIDIMIHSGGGIITEGLPIYDLISKSKANTTAIDEGLAASMAGVIFQAADVRVMYKNSRVMVHRARGWVSGNYQEIVDYAEIMLSYEDSLKDIFLEKTGLSNDVVEGWFNGADHYFNAEQAIENGLADKVLDVSSEPEDSAAMQMIDFGSEKEAFLSFKNKMFTSQVTKNEDNMNEFIKLLNKEYSLYLGENSSELQIMSALKEHHDLEINNYSTQIKELSDKIKAEGQKTAESLVDSHISRGAIVAGEENKTRDFWVNMALHDFEGVKLQLEAMKHVENINKWIDKSKKGADDKSGGQGNNDPDFSKMKSGDIVQYNLNKLYPLDDSKMKTLSGVNTWDKKH